jgi:O-antigen/teichoic acid export membrane protein
VLGLWTLTLWEYVLTLLRLDERARAYFALTVVNVVVTIPVTVWLVAVEDQGAAGILLGTFGTGVIFLAWRLWQERRRLSFVPELPLLRRMLRFGLPTMPAELTLYSLNFIDRILIVRLAGLAEAGLYALAIKFAQGINVIARGFQLAFPPLAYSIVDDDEARRAYSLIFTWFAAVCAFSVAGLWLLSRWIVDLLAAPEYFEAYEAVGLLATGVSLYALYLVLVVILGRTGRTEFNLPATAAGTAVNIVLNLVLIPPLGIVGAGLALVASYLVVLAAMYVLTQRLFPVPYEWGRLLLLVTVTAATVAGGELLLPDSGLDGFALRAALWLALPALLWAGGFLSAAERTTLRTMLAPSAVRARLRALGSEPEGERAGREGEEGYAPEVYEQAARDEDRI